MANTDSHPVSSRRTNFGANVGPLTANAVKRLRRANAAKKAGGRARPHWQSRQDSSSGAMDALLNGDLNLTWN